MKLLSTVLPLLIGAHAAASVPHPFGIQDLVMLDRVSDPQISPDGKRVAYQVRETDYDNNKGKNGIWALDLRDAKAQPLRLTDAKVNASTPRWAADGSAIYYQDKGQLWRQPSDGKGAAVEASHLALDINAYKFSPDGKSVLLSIDTWPACATEADAIACTKRHADEKAKSKATGRVYDKLFIRHWDTWADGSRSQLYVAAIGNDGALSGTPKLISRDIDGDMPSKPFGGDDEFAFSPDGKTVYFSVRIAGTSEPWSTNFDI
ncbi:MAG: PD40 domain-containing protein, partial [Proteobacteria bacterium]|nr:PD40 domain-containing protein [Pseudomonadota bacterium]